jgi:His/Glu/Gln/Arg/opine family amino acid ABC transporter permease subunit
VEEISEEPAELVERVAALDIGKAMLVACVRVPHDTKPGRRRQEIRTFATTTRSLLGLADWLDCLGVTRVVMEATSTYWKPPFYLLEESCECWLVTRRQRARITRGVQYLLFAAGILLLASLADWGQIRRAFFDLEVVDAIFPQILTTYLLNTVTYTAAAFAFGLVLGLVLALMRLSSVAPYRWLANIYIEFFRGVPALLVILAFGFGIPIAFNTTFPGGTLGTIAAALGLVAAAYGRDDPSRHPGRAQRADRSGAVAWHVSWLGDDLDRASPGLSDHPAAADQRADLADQGLLAGLPARPHPGGPGAGQIQPRRPEPVRQHDPHPCRRPVLSAHHGAAELCGPPSGGQGRGGPVTR